MIHCFGGPSFNPRLLQSYFLTELEPKYRPSSDRPTFPALSSDAFRSALTRWPLPWYILWEQEKITEIFLVSHQSVLGQQDDPLRCTPRSTIFLSPDPHFLSKLEPLHYHSPLFSTSLVNLLSSFCKHF